MKLSRLTTSFCTTCYREIPATISIDHAGVWMKKNCPSHGETRAMVERDPLFYTYVMGLQSPSIYNGYFLDVTRRCNLRCEYCFYNLEQADPLGEYSIESLLAEARTNAHNAPIILTGGEPTLRPDIADVIKHISTVGPVELLSNGTKLAEPEFFNEIMPLITSNEGIATLNLSIHTKETSKWKEVIELARSNGIKIESALIVVDSRESFESAVQICRESCDVVTCFRIKGATSLWNETKPKEDSRIFISDMVKWLEEKSPTQIVTKGRHNKNTFINVWHAGMFLMLVSWYDVQNVDLQDIGCAPYYRARNGEIANLVTACIINEGMEKGWLKGRKIEPLKR